MKKIKGICFLAFASVILSCNNGSDNQCLITEQTTPANNILNVVTRDKCKNNVKVVEREYIMFSKDSLIPHGYYREYYNNGKLKILGKFNHGMQDSVGILFYPNGRINVKNFFSEGTLSGPQYTYFENGKVKSVTFHKNDTSKWFGVDYLSDGTLKKVYGKPLHIVLRPNYETQKIGDVFACLNEVATLMGTQTVLHVKFEFGGHIIADSTIDEFKKINNTDFFGFAEKLKMKGVYVFSATVDLIDTSSKKSIASDTKQLKIRVN